MGYSRWDDSAYKSYADTTNYRSMKREEVFVNRSMNEKLDPRNVLVGKGDRKGLQLRESIISEGNPNPTPIILGLDVTGSMRDVVHQIATVELPKLMTEIHARGVVTDPHVMFMGIDDVHAIRGGHGALQVSYFEPDLKIVEQLRNLWLVGNGGGNESESYDLAWYFAGRYTYLENFEKTGKPGFLFTIGDEPFPVDVNSAEQLQQIFGPGEYENTTPLACLKAAQRKFQVFHVSVEKGGYNLSGWDKNLGNNHLRIAARDLAHLTEVVLATMRIANGADINEVIASSDCPSVLRHAFSNALKG
jgi:hypothetical protein